jgi:ABC-type sugar transport system ATPase subunit
MGDMLLEMKNISIAFYGVKALDNVSISEERKNLGF